MFASPWKKKRGNPEIPNLETTIFRRRDVEFFREKNPFASHFFIDSAHFFQCFLIHPIFKHKVKVLPPRHDAIHLTSW